MVTLLLILVVAISFPGTAAFIRWSEKRRILDIPNERSSHRRPVPVGAGIVLSGGVLIPYILFLLLDGYLGDPSTAVSVTLLYAVPVALAGVTIIGWIDDLKGLPVLPRLLVHIAAASLAVGVFFWSQPVVSSSGILFGGFSLLTAVGLTNAYNFMDGIDGIAGLQGLVSGLFWGVMGTLAGVEVVAFLGFAIALAAGTFLFFNWSPARVFLGDSGSGFLGLAFAVMPIMAARELFDRSTQEIASPTYLILAAIFTVWPFVFDSSLTFLRRLFRGERVWKPHRDHLYQRMIICGETHDRVALKYGVGAGACSFAAGFWLIGWVSILAPLTASLVVSVALMISLELGVRKAAGSHD